MDKFKELFSKTTKALAKNHCESEMDVNFSDLLELIQRSTELGLVHNPKYFETHQNQPLKITEKDYKNMSSPETLGRFLDKAINAFQPNAAKHVTAHFFDSPSGEWHCFYWLGADIVGAEGGKIWGNVSHIHYTSYLFNTKRDDCEDRITASGVEGVDKAHLRKC